MLFIIVGAQLFCGMSSITSASRMLYAFSRDRATPGHQLWRQLNARAGAVHRRARDRRARVPLRLPGVLRHGHRRRRGLRRLCRGHVDRDDRALHRVRDPDLPAAAPRRRVGAGRVEPRQARTSGSGSIAVLWVGVHLDPLHPAAHPDRDPVARTGSPGCRFNYAPIAVIGTFLLVGGWWLVSAQEVVQGPDRRRARTRSSRASSRSTATARPPGDVRGVGSISIPDRGSRRRAGSLHEGGPDADARRADATSRAVDRHRDHGVHRHAGPPARQAPAPRLLPRAGRSRATASEGCNYLLALDMEMDPVPGYEIASLGARLRRLRAASRSRRRCGGFRGSRRRRSSCATSPGTTGSRCGRRRGRCCARRSSGRGRSGSR